MPEIIPNWHPIFVHFTVALLSLSVGLFLVIPLIKPPLKEQWRIVACWSLWFGVGLTVLTGLSGLYAYNTVAHDTPSHLAMTEHRNWAIVTMAVFLVLALWSIFAERKKRTLGTVFMLCLTLAGSLLVSTAWHGGEVVYRYGVGVMSLPKSDTHAHEAADHNHGESEPGLPGESHDNAHDHNTAEAHDEAVHGMDFSGMELDERDEHHDDGHAH